MFVGHYGVALATKSERTRIPLWILFVAVQLLDFIWALCVLLGIEKMRVIPGFTAGSPIDAFYMPYSHSLIGALGWCGVTFVIYKVYSGTRVVSSAAFLVSLAVASHWVLDLMAHPRDLAIYDDTWKVGFGLLKYRGLEFGLEVAILVFGIVLYLARNALTPKRRWGVIVFGAGLIVIQVGNTFVPRGPLSEQARAIGVLTFYTLFAGVAFLLEKPHSRSKPRTESLRER